MEAGLGRGRRAISRTVWHGFSTRGCGIPQHWPVLGPRSKTKDQDIAEYRDHGLKTHATSLPPKVSRTQFVRVEDFQHAVSIPPAVQSAPDAPRDDRFRPPDP